MAYAAQYDELPNEEAINQWRARLLICTLACQLQLSAQRHESGCREPVGKNDSRHLDVYNQPRKAATSGRGRGQHRRGSPPIPFRLPPRLPLLPPFVKKDPCLSSHPPPHYREEVYLGSFSLFLSTFQFCFSACSIPSSLNMI